MLDQKNGELQTVAQSIYQGRPVQCLVADDDVRDPVPRELLPPARRVVSPAVDRIPFAAVSDPRRAVEPVALGEEDDAVPGPEMVPEGLLRQPIGQALLPGTGAERHLPFVSARSELDRKSQSGDCQSASGQTSHAPGEVAGQPAQALDGEHRVERIDRDEIPHRRVVEEVPGE